jgi:probable HAF family extracellular repeat protein
MIDLHGSDNGRYSSGLAVNAKGQVVGFSYAIYPASFDDRAFMWTEAAGMIDLTDQSTVSDPGGLNNTGQVVGSMEALPLKPDYNRAFSWTESGGIVDLGTLDRTASVANDINSSGQVVGSAHSSAGPDRAFLWTQEDGMVDLGTLEGSAHALAINDHGQVVGDSATVGDYGQSHAISWTQVQGMVDLGTAGQSESGAWKVNARGEIIGYGVLYRPRTMYRGLMWEPIANLGCVETLADCNLKGVALAGAYLAGADLRGANLKGANFARANLSAANFTDTNLKDVNFSNATLVGAQITGANVHDVIWLNTICPDGTNSDANGGTCEGHLVPFVDLIAQPQQLSDSTPSLGR